MKSFQQTQLLFAKHLREPALYPAPADMEDRRMGIYRELIYNNIESLIATVFPVLRSILKDQQWHVMVRDFIHRHQCQTPYFLEISEEFLRYLAQERGLREGDPPFLLELAHYEWIELALDVSEEIIPDAGRLPDDLMLAKPRISPLVANLSYQFPVHKVSPNFQPQTVTPTQLVVYRNRTDKVCFIQANPLSQRLLALLQSHSLSLDETLGLIAEELQQRSYDELAGDAQTLIKSFYSSGVVSHFD
ncbi:HvfC family RiPP maturation protein [Cellvibrio sp. OA-2007]|uniref:HvfC family RiPP maturation protein n=1 Tax=Cellvibrio sp. OA-2007 TaxID=529823 RepID=UPI00078564D3|nr:putative DNA-binding domain-containing protein [Cellvibrio sp. OA-2007]